MKRSRKQAHRDALTSEQVRARKARKTAEADMALWLAVGGKVGWEQELVRRRADRNERTRKRTRDAMQSRRAGDQGRLFEDIA